MSKLRTKKQIQAELDKGLFIREELRNSRAVVDSSDYLMMQGYVAALRFVLGQLPGVLSTSQAYSDLKRLVALKMLDDVEYNKRLAVLNLEEMVRAMKFFKS